jgi:predicted transcriptional regulator
MNSPHDKQSTDDVLLGFTTEIVASHVSNNRVDAADLADLIDTVFAKLSALSAGSSGSAQVSRPAVPIEESVTPDHIICLEDGRRFKMLKKHLKAHYDMTPAEYRAKWNLPADYPMVAPNYAAKRRRLARESGLGKSRN